MIFRAAIAIGLVWLLAPHEPDIGFGRPETRNQLNKLAASLISASLSQYRINTETVQPPLKSLHWGETD